MTHAALSLAHAASLGLAIPHIYAVYDRISGTFPANNTIYIYIYILYRVGQNHTYTVYIYTVLVNPI
jgi:hypothetical protein